ncbi:MAG: BrnT family toxin [Candidatus Acidiferrum sp.]
MRFTWDEQKNAANLAKHGVSFERATLVFDDPRTVSLPDDCELEERWLTIGLVNGVVVLVVVHTLEQRADKTGNEDEDEDEDENEEEVRIISARKATRREREVYERARQNP